MLLPNSTQLASYRAIDEMAMPDTGIIKRKSSTADGKGGQIITWATVATVKCRLATTRAQSADGATGDRLGNVAEFIVRFPVGTDVRNSDRIEIGTRTFEVVKPVAHTYQTSLRVQVVEVT